MTIPEIIDQIIIPIQLAAAMYGMGAALRPQDFTDTFRYPKSLVLGIVLQLGLVPLVAIGFAEVFNLGPAWAIGLLILAVVPGGSYSNLMTYIAKGNVPLSISLTILSTALSFVAIPLLLELYASTYLSGKLQLDTWEIIWKLLLYALLPLIVGMLLFRYRQSFAEATSNRAIQLSVLGMVVIIVLSLFGGRIKVLEFGFGPPLIILAFIGVLAIIIPQICYWFKCDDKTILALALEVIVRNLAIALFLVPFFFAGQDVEQGKVFYTILFFGGAELLGFGPIILLGRAGKSIVLFRKR